MSKKKKKMNAEEFTKLEIVSSKSNQEKKKNQRCKVSKNLGGLGSPFFALIKIKPQFTK